MKTGNRNKFEVAIIALAVVAVNQVAAQCSHYDPSVPSLLGANMNGYGRDILQAQTTNNSECTAVGYRALNSGAYVSKTTAFGADALLQASSNPSRIVFDCTAIGAQAMYSFDQGNYNTAVGKAAMYTNLSDDDNVAIGHSSMYYGTGVANSAIGYRSYFGISSPPVPTNGGNTAFGALTLSDTYTDFNTAFGMQALELNGQGYFNTAAGYQALSSNNSGYLNTAIGSQALFSNNSGTRNTAVGRQALYSNYQGSDNVAIGAAALYSNIMGSENVAVGVSALWNNDTQGNNVALGTDALYNNRDGSNVGIGYAALYTNSNNSGSDQNTAIGVYAIGGLSSIGNKNTVAGYYATLNGSYSEAGAFGNAAVATGNQRIQLGNLAITKLGGQPATFTWPSDSRFKEDLDYQGVAGLPFIMKLRPVTYFVDTRALTEHVTKSLPDTVRKVILNQDFTESMALRRSGFIAQEVEQAAKDANYEFSGVVLPQNENGHYALNYASFVVPLVKAVQEQQDILKNSVATIQNQIEESIEINKSGNTLSGLVKISKAGFDIQVKPNPFTDEAAISISGPVCERKLHLIVSSLSGVVVLEKELSKEATQTIVVKASEIGTGMFTCSIYCGTELISSQKLVVSK